MQHAVDARFVAYSSLCNCTQLNTRYYPNSHPPAKLSLSSENPNRQ